MFCCSTGPTLLLDKRARPSFQQNTTAVGPTAVGPSVYMKFVFWMFGVDCCCDLPYGPATAAIAVPAVPGHDSFPCPNATNPSTFRNTIFLTVKLSIANNDGRES